MMCSQYGSMAVGMLIGILAGAVAEFSAADSSSLKHIANVSFAAEDTISSGSASMFSPRMDFEQWRPLTGRGDPLRNDPTYDYEPPVLERVHYWADDTRLEREHYPDRKSEVLMLGVSSRKPSMGPRQPPLPSRRPHRPPPSKYEEFQYKLSDHYPMTILVPPPPPPPGHKTPLFILGDENLSQQTPHPRPEPPFETKEPTTNTPEHLTSLYALQESNLIYQSSTTNHNWIINSNQTRSNYSSVSSDYAGWGPTTPLDESDVNETLNFILNDNFEMSKHPYAFYKPMLSESPPPPRGTLKPILLPTFIPTALPPTETHPPPITSFTDSSSVWTTSESTTETPEYYEDTTTDNQIFFQPSVPTPVPTFRPSTEKTSIFDMLGSMMSMPLVNGPERPEDNLYAHASTNVHVFKEQLKEDSAKLETMQTMQPPPITRTTEKSPVPANKHANVNPFVPSGFSHKQPPAGHDPYLHMRYTTHTPTTEFSERKPTTEAPAVPMYLIIQGHSKVKTYGSKPKPITQHSDAFSNEIPKQNETNEVKHLHTKEKAKHDKPASYRTSRTQNLKALVENGLGSIEIQEANVGIKYDVSDGSDVPAEIYRKGIVDSDVDIDNYKKNAKKEPRRKRQVDLEDLIPFDEDTIEEYVFDFLKSHKNETGVTGLIAQAVTSDTAASVVDDLDEDDDDEEDDDDDDDDEDR